MDQDGIILFSSLIISTTVYNKSEKRALLIVFFSLIISTTMYKKSGKKALLIAFLVVLFWIVGRSYSFCHEFLIPIKTQQNQILI